MGDDDGETLLEPGPTAGAELAPPDRPSESWSTFLGDAQRSAYAAVPVLTAGLRIIRRTDLPAHGATEWRELCASGDALTAPTVAAGKVFVANPDAAVVYALDAATGKKAWHYAAGGVVDSPPTVARGRCVFGAGGGWVYALRADDRALFWRRRLARSDRRIVMLGQVQSAWPVSGSVLALGERVLEAAGWYNWAAQRNWLYSLDLANGNVVWADGRDSPNRGGVLTVSADGKVVGHDPSAPPPAPDGHRRGRRGVHYLGPETYSIAEGNPLRRGKGHDTILTARDSRRVYRFTQQRGQLRAYALASAKRHRAKREHTCAVAEAERRGLFWVAGRELAEAWLKLHNVQKLPVRLLQARRE